MIDLYVAPSGEDLGRLSSSIDQIVAQTALPEGIRVTLRGSVQGMRSSFRSFGLGLILSVALVYLILVAQFESYLDPFIILLAIPPGLTGVLLILAPRQKSKRPMKAHHPCLEKLLIQFLFRFEISVSELSDHSREAIKAPR